jgi:lipopolysaccharide export system ATP-binding protein
MVDGQIFKEGAPEDLAADQKVRELYLGQSFMLKRKYSGDRV